MGLGSHIDVTFQFCQEESFRLILYFIGGVGGGWGVGVGTWLEGS